MAALLLVPACLYDTGRPPSDTCAARLRERRQAKAVRRGFFIRQGRKKIREQTREKVSDGKDLLFLCLDNFFNR